jgi:hypothetical protein
MLPATVGIFILSILVLVFGMLSARIEKRSDDSQQDVVDLGTTLELRPPSMTEEESKK